MTVFSNRHVSNMRTYFTLERKLSFCINTHGKTNDIQYRTEYHQSYIKRLYSNLKKAKKNEIHFGSYFDSRFRQKREM